MTRLWTGLVCASLWAGSPVVSVDEAATRIFLQDQRTTAQLAIGNADTASVLARIHLQWLYPSGVAISEAVRDVQLAPGRNVLTIPIEPENDTGTVWLRLRYRIEAGGSETSGILAVAAKAEHFFELHLTTPSMAQAGETVSIPVHASHPVTRQPVAGVHVRAEGDSGQVSEGLTGPDGIALLRLNLPEASQDDDEVEIRVEGRLGDFSQEVEASFPVSTQPRIILTTDKPLYQPGQTMHLRALVFRPNGRAMSGAGVSLRVVDPDDIKVFTASVETSRFGVAAADWTIPDNLRLGDYEVTLHSESFSSQPRLRIKISRYDLPEFTVSAKPDRRYYLPGQDAVIEVKAEYLFGRPVPRGHVRLVRESSRRWDWRLQKWDIDEAESYEAIADKAGRCLLHVKLAAGWKKGEAWDRYSDLRFTAYYRDRSTGRTEQRRFDLRISREPLHIYQANGYVFTSYADGTPAACIVRVGDIVVKTNGYGVARLPDGVRDGEITLAADDGRGAKGRLRERYFHRERREVRIRTDRTLYRPHETVHVEIDTEEDLSGLAFTIRSSAGLIEARWLALQGRHAAFTIPWRPEFRQEVFLIASWGEDSAARTILFPAGDNLQVNVKPAAAVYRPGEEASATIQVDLGGRQVESVLGIAVVDRAVIERTEPDTPAVAGISRDDLNKLDVSQPIPEGLDLLAEALLAPEGWGARTETSEEYFGGLAGAFWHGFDEQFRPVSHVLDARYKKDYAYPRDRESLRAFLRAGDLDVESLRDPWGMPFEVRHKIEGPTEALEIVSAGPDKQFGTRDDLQAWSVRRFHFQATHDNIRRAFDTAVDFPVTADGARIALRAAGIDADHLPDPWGHMYRLRTRIFRNQSVVSFESAGPDGIFGTEDDFAVGQVSGSYFAHMEHLLGLRLAESKHFPRNTREWRAFLRKAKLDPRDPWGERLHPVFTAKSANSDLRKLYTAVQYPGPAASKIETVPVRLHSLSITLRSSHGDGFDVATFSRDYRFEATKENRKMRPGVRSDPGGTIAGRVTDPTGAGVRCAAVTAMRAESGYGTRCDVDGSFRLSGLEPGLYEVRVESPGFQVHITSNVPVAIRRNTMLDLVLRLGSVSEAVVVEAAPVMLNTSTAQVARVADVPRSTPRLREYFPETLLWQPSLETGPGGQAQLRFKLADNITTWQINVIASTVDGDVGRAGTEIRAFQPFFISHDPPRVLTQDDRIDMTATVRNYLDQTQNVAVSLQPEHWFELAGPARHDARVASGGAANAVFPLRVTAVVANGKPRVTASSAAASDAIEKPVTVHPDGQEISITSNALLREEGRLSFELPARAIPNSQRVELKMYPNLLSHLVESIEGILERPHGCAEQTISSTYPNVMLLRYLERTGRTSHPLAQQARRYVRAGVDRLLGYITESGGLSYWARGEANTSLTAYGIHFLRDAGEFAPVDKQVIEQMSDALWKMQSAAGSWDTNLQTTAYVTQALAAPRGPAGLRRALDFLQAESAKSDDPYLIAAHAMATHKTGDAAARNASLERLRSLVHSEAGLSYWRPKTSTPFYGWSLAGDLESTAIAVQALATAANPGDSELITQAMLFLLRNKDRYGVWHSTQATVQVLAAILDATGKEPPSAATTAEVVVNGRPAMTLAMPLSADVTGPVRADISQFLVTGTNRVEVRRRGGGAAQMQIAGAYYVPWQKYTSAEDLKFSVQYDRITVATGAPVTCRVHAEHTTLLGRGMLLAEIGLPPGADVDRQSLDGAGIDHYDILPDRVVVYLWPRASGADFSFRFRPRFAMLAKTAPSLLYDYYNPAARSVVPPVVFTVSGSKLSTASAADSRPSARSASASRSAGRAASPPRNSRTSGS